MMHGMNDAGTDARQNLVFPSVDCEASEVGVWLAALGDCRARTYKTIVGMRAEEMDRVCSSDMNSIGTLLYHIAAIELDWLYSEVLVREFPSDFQSWFPHDVRDPEGRLTAVTGDDATRYEGRFHYVRAPWVEALGRMSLSEFRRVRHLEAYDVSPQWVVHHLLQHEAQHRGQIAILRHRFREFRARSSSPAT